MKERPILFSGPMVRAILEGRKTQTRRVVKVPEPFHFGSGHFDADYPNGRETFLIHGNCGTETTHCPYGQPGDRLWVRETWRPTWASAGPISGPGIEYKADGSKLGRLEAGRFGQSFSVDDPWRPSIHMPRWASRITLEVTGVRVERLQDISEADAAAEGVDCDIWDQALVTRDYSADEGWFQEWSDDIPGYVPLEKIYRESFRTLWDQINGKTYPWASNPWVWVVEFQRLDT